MTGAPLDPVRPPAPSPEPPAAEPERPRDEDSPEAFLPEGEGPWGLGQELLERLTARAEAYARYAVRFSCLEHARAVTYVGGEAKRERQEDYLYLLERNSNTLSEFRQRLRKDGRVAGETITEQGEGFPPAYAWAFLFSRFHQGYFEYRHLWTGFVGFDWARVIQFRGSLPWTDGRDIREWEGIVILDAATLTPLEVRAEPAGQRERMRALYERYMRSFSILGFRLAPKPLGYRCRVLFRERREELTFPTELRYDTLRMVSAEHSIPVAATIREYRDYRFVKVETEERVEEQPREP